MDQPDHDDGSGAPPESNAKLPHDRDERARPPVENAQHRANRAVGEQAHADVESGAQDTERYGTPNDVPSSDENGSER